MSDETLNNSCRDYGATSRELSRFISIDQAAEYLQLLIMGFFYTNFNFEDRQEEMINTVMRSLDF